MFTPKLAVKKFDNWSVFNKVMGKMQWHLFSGHSVGVLCINSLFLDDHVNGLIYAMHCMSLSGTLLHCG